MKTTYGNQRAITINRNMPQKGENRKFLTVHYDAITTASRNLSGEAAFKLYLYLLSNQDKYTDNFSPANFSKEFGVSVDRCRKVFDQLVEVGYLIHTGGNEYQFYEMPQKKNTIKIVAQEKRYVEQEDGSFVLMTYNEVYQELKNDCAPDFINELWSNCRKEEN